MIVYQFNYMSTKPLEDGVVANASVGEKGNKKCKQVVFEL